MSKNHTFNTEEIDNTDFLDFSSIPGTITFTRADFLQMAITGESGTVNLTDYAGWLNIKADGIYVNIDHEETTSLTPQEAAALSAHPTGDLTQPVLTFPFTLNKLKKFLKFTNKEGLDFPVVNNEFMKIINSKNGKNHLLNTENKVPLTYDEVIITNYSKRKKHIIQIANEIWRNKKEGVYRVTEAAQAILEELTTKGMYEIPSLDTIKYIIRPYAPESAKKPGRPTRK
ncbi:hypothetical protein I5485_21835 [Citrobacter farmeri]|uniref:hypothetical protein n=1 Tax=Citrobacter farmeri TaxID=67824 RepID=UPI001904FBD6|nr:hypothetical protein [Citrobacter farmeri]MBJ9165086.1 hypothetical protein [Citrobacter farmeri]